MPGEPRAAPSRYQPIASTELEAGADLKLGEFQTEDTLSLSEARIILKKTLETRVAHGHRYEEQENTTKTRDYLEIFSPFKDIQSAGAIEGAIESRFKDTLEKFEKAQLKSLVPTCADEAKALIPSLEKKCEKGVIDEAQLDDLCADMQKTKRQAELEG